ncbi:hypothetical protein ACTFIZ_003377 [Dictyostelium cf. discoideum]
MSPRKSIKLNVGGYAPEFLSSDKDGKIVTLKDFINKNQLYYISMVKMVYHLYHTPVCTKEACEFRDRYEKFVDAGVDVIGISCDDSESHSKFSMKYKLPFTLLSDKDGKIAKSYGVKGLLLPCRTTFIIDTDGKILMTYSALLSATSHIEESLKVIQNLKLKQRNI